MNLLYEATPFSTALGTQCEGGQVFDVIAKLMEINLRTIGVTSKDIRDSTISPKSAKECLDI